MSIRVKFNKITAFSNPFLQLVLLFVEKQSCPFVWIQCVVTRAEQISTVELFAAQSAKQQREGSEGEERVGEGGRIESQQNTCKLGKADVMWSNTPEVKESGEEEI